MSSGPSGLRNSRALPDDEWQERIRRRFVVTRLVVSVGLPAIFALVFAMATLALPQHPGVFAECGRKAECVLTPNGSTYTSVLNPMFGPSVGERVSFWILPGTGDVAVLAGWRQFAGCAVAVPVLFLAATVVSGVLGQFVRRR